MTKHEDAQVESALSKAKLPPMAQAGQNVGYHLDTDTGFLLLIVDTNQRLGPSSTGKSTTIGTTNGAQVVITPKGPISIGLNVYEKIKIKKS